MRTRPNQSKREIRIGHHTHTSDLLAQILIHSLHHRYHYFSHTNKILPSCQVAEVPRFRSGRLCSGRPIFSVMFSVTLARVNRRIGTLLHSLEVTVHLKARIMHGISRIWQQRVGKGQNRRLGGFDHRDWGKWIHVVDKHSYSWIAQYCG